MNKFLMYFTLLFSFIFCASQVSAQNNNELRMYVFLSEKCPICQSSTLELKRLAEKFKNQNVKFIGVFPNTDMSNEETILNFKQKYTLNFELYLDVNHALTDQFDATVTPQAFVIEVKSGKIMYSGKIDNSFERVGKRRKVVTEYYLESALENYRNQKSINPVQTNPVGCFISY